MNALVIGYGSIGTRHAGILAGLGCSVAVVSSRAVVDYPCISSISEAVREFAPDYVVVASETARHGRDVTELAVAGFGGIVLVEKPLFDVMTAIPVERFWSVYVAYNLRFHPLLKRLLKLLAGERVISAQAYVGLYLPLWRPGRDFRSVYSASKEQGGGVLRDLSHELDLLIWLFGDWQRLTAIGGHLSDLEINSDDMFALMMTFERCPVVTLELNYLDRVGRRRIVVNGIRKTYEADFMTGVLMVDGEREEYGCQRDHTYVEMHRAILEGRSGDVCSFDEGLGVVAMIDAAEMSAVSGGWVFR